MQKLEWLDREELIKKFVSVEFNRFLDYYKNSPDLNAPHTSSKRTRQSRKSGKASAGGFNRFFINLGKTDDLKPVELIGMINDNTGIRDINIGEINIMKNFSFFEADKSFTDEILTGFKGKSFKKRKITLELAERKNKDSRSNSGKNKKVKDYRKDIFIHKVKRKRRKR